MPTKCRLLGELVSSAGVPIPLARVTFTPKDGAIRPLPPLTIVPEAETGRTDENGMLLALDGGPFEVYPGVYSIRVKQGLHPAYPTMTGTVPEAETALLSDIQNLTPPVPLNEAQLAVLAAQQARDQAREAAGEAAADAVPAAIAAVDEALSAKVQAAQDAQAAAEGAAGAAAADAVAQAVPGAIAAVDEALAEKVAAAEQAREGAETAAGTAAAEATAEVEALLDGKVTAAEEARSGAAEEAGAATTQAGLASAAKTAAETARDAAIAAGATVGTYGSTAAGLAAVAEGAKFWAPSGADTLQQYTKTGGTAVEVAGNAMPTAAFVASVQAVSGESAVILSNTIRKSRNLFNPNADDYSIDHVVSHVSGALLSSVNYDTSGVIDVEPETQYYIYPKSALAWYDQFGSVLSGSPNTDANPVQTSPALGRQLRVSLQKSIGHDAETAYVIEGDQPLDVYEPFGGVVNVDALQPLPLSKIPDGIDTDKIAFTPSTENLFITETVTPNTFMATNGVPQSSASYVLSDFLKVTPGQVLTAGPPGNNGPARAPRYITAFDAMKVVRSADGAAAAVERYTVPASVEYIRISVRTEFADSFKIEVGEVQTPYVKGGAMLSEDVYIPPDRLAVVPPSFGKERLRKTAMLLMRRMLGESGQINILAVGDSYTHNADRWTGPVAEALIAEAGDGGGGWTGYNWFGSNGTWVIGGAQPTGVNGNARPALYPVRFKGTWTSTYPVASPDCGAAQSSTPGDMIERGVPASPDHTALRVLFIGTADGVARYRVDGGAWTTVNTQGTVDAVGYFDIALTAGAHTVQIEVVSGTVKLCGDNALSSADGVRFHKCGWSGSRVSQWVGVSATQQQAAWALLAPDLFIAMDGTNSQTTEDAPGVWSGNIATLLDRARLAAPSADQFIIMPAENARPDNKVPMAEYARFAMARAKARICAFLDLQTFFGDDPSEYGPSSALPLLHADLIHPLPETGGRRMGAAILGMLRV